MLHILDWSLERKYFGIINMLIILTGIFVFTFMNGKEAEVIGHVITIILGLRLGYYFKFIGKNNRMLVLISSIVFLLGVSLLGLFREDFNKVIDGLESHLRSY